MPKMSMIQKVLIRLSAFPVFRKRQLRFGIAIYFVSNDAEIVSYEQRIYAT